jgi:uncharacterized protein (DUF697 family)
MSTYEAYESGPFETQEAYEGSFESGEGPFETYETYEGEDEQFLGSILGALTGEAESPLSETQEMELAAELLEVTSEEELEEFIGDVFKKVAKTVGSAIRSPIGRQLGGILKGVAKKALPMVGGALGSFVAPGVGTAIGSKLGSMASNLFEMETEGMNAEQLEFEMARRYVRLAATAAGNAAQAPRNAPPRRVVQTAVTQAARQHAPGLLRGTRGGGASGGRRPRPGGPQRPGGQRRRGPGGQYAVGSSTVAVPGGNGAYEPEPSDWGGEPEPGGGQRSPYGSRAQSGRWIRRGRKVVLLGV